MNKKEREGKGNKENKNHEIMAGFKIKLSLKPGAKN